MLYIDTGSSTVKLYEWREGKVKLLKTKSFDFKKDFNPDYGLSEQGERELVNYFLNIRNDYPNTEIKVFATAIFRKMSKTALRKLSDKILQMTGLHFDVISQELEGFYLEQALSARYISNKPLLLINIGGGSTELIIKQDGEVIERVYLELGVRTVLTRFPHINDEISKHSLEEVLIFVKTKLPQKTIVTPVAIYNGGELTYMEVAGYDLDKNEVFEDIDHPKMINLAKFQARNREIFQSMQLSELEKYMPEDPLWMHGARACSAIAQAICEKFQVKTIVPSDSNTVHGMIRQELLVRD